MQRLSIIAILFIGLISAGCQTSMIKQFNQVESGMDKDDVLEIMGSPTRSERFHGKDRWTYVFYDQQIRHEKEVQFFQGNAIYVGDIWQPPTEQSAVAIDQKHAENEKLIAEQEAKENAVLKAARQEYEQYQAQTNGADEKVRYLPTFEGVR